MVESSELKVEGRDKPTLADAASTLRLRSGQVGRPAIRLHICASNTNHFGIIPIVPSHVSTN